MALLSDVHFDPGFRDNPGQCNHMADVLLLRAVQRINRFLKPDVVLVLGDLVRDGEAPGALMALEALKDCLANLDAPVIAIPGNHDPDGFYNIFKCPPPIVEFNGVRLIPFVDADEPGFNARRLAEDMGRFAEARADFDGPIIALQHVPVFPPGAADCPYNHSNADEIIAAMQQYGVGLAISGHFHDGMPLMHTEHAAFFAAGALCEPPYAFYEIVLDGHQLSSIAHSLSMPEALQLADTHVHSEFAYCGENVAVAPDIELAALLGLSGLRITEHTGQLYFDKETFWEARFMPDGLDTICGRAMRVDEYFTLAHSAQRLSNMDIDVRFGFEVDSDFTGRPVLREQDRKRAAFLNGALHWLPELRKPEPDIERAGDEFLGIMQRFVPSGIDVLAHPFRVFSRAKVAPPTAIFDPLVRMLREHGVAAEINFHVQEPQAAFVRRCLDARVKLTLGSDAHNLYEVGELWPHLRLLETCGFDGDLRDILLV